MKNIIKFMMLTWSVYSFGITDGEKLFKAITAKNVELVAKLIPLVDINEIINSRVGRPSYLYQAVLTDDLEIFEMLIDAGADIKANGIPYDQRNFMDLIISDNRLPMFEMLLAKGLDLKVFQGFGGFFSKIIKANRLEMFELLIAIPDSYFCLESLIYLNDTIKYDRLEMFNKLINLLGVDTRLMNPHEDNFFGDVILFSAVQQENPIYFETLINKGIYVNIKNSDGYSALHVACPHAVKVLISEGIDVNVKDESGNTPLHFQCLKNKEVVKTLLEAGAQVNIKNDNGNTPLYCAVGAYSYSAVSNFRDIHPDMVNLLLEAGAQVNLQNKYGNTPLHCTLLNGCNNLNSEVIKLLVEAGAQVNMQNNHGETPLHCVVSNSFNISADVVKLLRKQGARVNIQNHKKNIPLHCALLSRCNQSVLQEIIAASTDHLEIKGTRGKTALQLAVSGKSDDSCIKALIDCGAEIGVKDKYNNTLLHLAKKTNAFERIAQLLIGCGVDPFERNDSGESAFDNIDQALKDRLEECYESYSCRGIGLK